MPSIAQFVKDSEETTITVRDIPIQVVYNPDRVTGRNITALAAFEKTLDFGVVTDFLATLLDSWDVTGPLYGRNANGDEVELVGDGETIPFEHDCMEALGFHFLSEFLQKLQLEAITGPNPTKGTRPSRKR